MEKDEEVIVEDIIYIAKYGKGCDGCVAELFDDLCHKLPPCSCGNEANDGISFIFEEKGLNKP
jgi:hypothetical protein